MLKDSRIDLRLDADKKAVFERAAAAQGLKLSEFVIAASSEAAEIALADQSRFTLDEAAMARFLARLEEPPAVLPKLRELFTRKSVFKG